MRFSLIANLLSSKLNSDSWQEVIMSDRDEFLYPRSRYYGQVKPENLVFNANLQEFAQRVSIICNLETNGKLPPEEAYNQIKALWKQLKRSKKQLGIGEKPPSEGEEL
jgi:isopropylmalate/homocitrate/citramalate synthase